MEWMSAIIGGTVYGEEGVEVASLFLEVGNIEILL